ncbi:membrane protein [Salmonella enterica subsp. arizonae]|uniref:Membrane protein n=1 Tax=Salmonella enterica subsp. arizonae TaxID=59203 RepID=A0A379SRX4_SALER|nr:membrane protein [Salmonella enterica subsp. arizonae]
MRLRSEVVSVAREASDFVLALNGETVATQKLVIASGGLSMPGLGASPFGYKIAEQFGLKVLPTRAGWCPLRCISRCWNSSRRCLACLFPA